MQYRPCPSSTDSWASCHNCLLRPMSFRPPPQVLIHWPASHTLLCRMHQSVWRASTLQFTWLDQAHFPSTIKEAAKRDPLPLGISPTQEHVEFTAPIVGDALPQHYEEAYARAKLEQEHSQNKASQNKAALSSQSEVGPSGQAP